MKVALTGATGFIGSHILTELQEHGHEVIGFAKDMEQANTLVGRGAKAAVVDIYDRTATANVFREADAAIHVASPGDETSAAFDSAAVDAATDAFQGTGKTWMQISGAWVYGDNNVITEESPYDAPAMVAWRQGVEQKALSISGARVVIPSSSVAYGDGGGALPGALLYSPRDEAGNLVMLGTGQQHWSTVHVADLADFFRRALESDTAHGYYVIGDGMNSTVAEITEAAAVAVGAPGAVSGSDDEARARLGEYLAEALLISQGMQSTKARTELGWAPTHPNLLEEFRTGSYHQ